MTRKYQVVIFDLDDTLIDNRESIRFAFERMMESAGFPVSETEFERWREVDAQFWRDRQDNKINIPAEFAHEVGPKSAEFLDWLRAQRFLRFFGDKVNLEQAIELNRVYVAAMDEKVVALPGAQEILQFLSGKYHIVIATNGPAAPAENKLAKIGALEYVNEVMPADRFGYMKPKVEFFEAIKKTLGIDDPRAYLVVGDSLKSDVGFGMNARIDSCWVNWGHEELPEGYQPTYVIENLLELKEIL